MEVEVVVVVVKLGVVVVLLGGVVVLVVEVGKEEVLKIVAVFC